MRVDIFYGISIQNSIEPTLPLIFHLQSKYIVNNSIIKTMNLQQIIKNQQLKKNLEKRKEDRIKKKLQQKQREKVNLDHSHLKTGKIEKTKIIEKKKFNTLVQKARKIQVQVQDNSNPSTFVAMSQEYLTILNRTQNYVKFDEKKLSEGCQAISAFAEAHKQKSIIVQITMENPIQCHETPVILRMPHPDRNVTCIVITEEKQEIQTKAINEIDMKILDLKQFSSKMRTDKKFKKEIIKKTNCNKIFCDMKTFSKSKLIKKLILKQIAIFPIDLKKVPFSLQEQVPNYKNYLKLLISSTFFVAKSGLEHRIYLKNKEISELKSNVVSLVHQTVAKLIHKNKGKGNKLTNVKIKSQTSIPIDIYG